MPETVVPKLSHYRLGEKKPSPNARSTITISDSDVPGPANTSVHPPLTSQAATAFRIAGALLEVPSALPPKLSIERIGAECTTNTLLMLNSNTAQGNDICLHRGSTESLVSTSEVNNCLNQAGYGPHRLTCLDIVSDHLLRSFAWQTRF